MKSIIQSEKICHRCGTPLRLHKHHCIEGIYRRASEKYGLTVWLCWCCHRTVHADERKMQHLRRIAQLKAMEVYNWTEDEFREHIGRSFI